MSVAIPKLTLVYFGFANRAEPIRLAAAIGRIAFTNKSIQYQDFSSHKDELPLGQLPILEIESGGKKLVIPQAHAILRYFGKLGGLYPHDPIESCQVDSMIDTVNDASRPLVMTIVGSKELTITEEHEWSNEEKIAIRKRAIDKVFPKYLGYLNNILKNNVSGWLVGDTVTIADLRLYQLATWIDSGALDGVPSSVLDTYPEIKQHMLQIREIPEVKEFYAKHSAPYGDFDYVPSKKQAVASS
jgi:glutathione S-transferase